MRHLRVAFVTLAMFSACGDEASGPGSDTAPPSNVFAWKIVHSDSAGLCRGEQCNRSTVVTGGEIIADDHEDWVSTLPPEEHTRIQGLATSPELAAFLQRDTSANECPAPTDYSARLDVRTVTHQGSGQSAFLSLTSNAYGCFFDAKHPAGAVILDLENLRKKHTGRSL